MAKKTIGVDLGGSHVLATIVEEGEIVARAEREIDDRTFESAFAVVTAAIDDVLATTKPKHLGALGIGSPGSIDLESGTVLYSPNFNWRDAPLGPRLRERYELPVFVGNDARCATLGEYAYGTGRGTRDFVLLTLGTGIGGGVVARGELALGHSGGAGEIGHHQIRATDGFVCNCGKTGCFEAQASGTGLIRHALALAPSFPRSELLAGKLGSKAIRKAAEAGEPHAVAAWTRFVDDLARGIANVIAFVNPETVALGGGVAAAGTFMLTALVPRVDALTTMAPKGQTRIAIAELGNDAGAIGAATMAAHGGLAAAQPRA
ncbi:MAG: ROK family glucokinase [Vulcanimicrobiaceae bacterium]